MQLYPFPDVTWTLPHVSFLFLYINSVCITLNYLYPCCQPLSLSSLSPHICSPAEFRWPRGAGWMGFYRVHALTHMHSQGVVSDLLKQGSRSFVPWAWKLFLPFPTSFRHLRPYQYLQVAADKLRFWSEKVRNLAVSLLLIGLVFLFFSFSFCMANMKVIRLSIRSTNPLKFNIDFIQNSHDKKAMFPFSMSCSLQFWKAFSLAEEEASF